MKTVAFICGSFLAAALLPDGLPAAGWGWDSLNGLGLVAMVVLVLLAWEAQTPSRREPLRLHQALAIAATGFVFLHALGFLLLDPVLLEHLKPTAPGPMLAAWLTLPILLFLCVMSFPRARRRVWSQFSAFRVWHLSLTGLMTVLVLVHVIGTGSAFAPAWKAGVLVLLMGGLPVAAYLFRRRGAAPPLSREPATLMNPAGFAVGITLAGLVLSLLYGWIRQP